MDTFELLPVLAAGDLSQTSAPELVAAIYRSRASGTLALEGEGREEIRLFFKLGNSCGAGKPAGFRSLAEILLAQKMLTPEQAERAAAESSASGKRLGEVLVGMRLLQPDQLQLALATQHRENLRLMLFRNVGRYEWRGWEPPPAWAGEVTVDPTRAILEALALPQLNGRRGAVLRWLGDAQIQASLDFAELAARAELLVTDRRAAELCATPLPPEQFLESTGLQRARAEALLVTLLLVGGVEPVPPEASQPLDASLFEPAPPELPADAYEVEPQRQAQPPPPPPPDPIRAPPVQRASTPPAPVQRASTPPAPVQRASTPPAPVQRVSTPPAPVQRASIPPAPVQRASTPPAPVQRASTPPAPVQRVPARRVLTPSPPVQKFVPPPPPPGFLDADELRVEFEQAALHGAAPPAPPELFSEPSGEGPDPLSMAAQAAEEPEHIFHDADPALDLDLDGAERSVEAVAQLDVDEPPSQPALAQLYQDEAQFVPASRQEDVASTPEQHSDEGAYTPAPHADEGAYTPAPHADEGAYTPALHEEAPLELAAPSDEIAFDLVEPSGGAPEPFVVEPSHGYVELEPAPDEPLPLTDDLDLVQPRTPHEAQADPFGGTRAPSGSGYLLGQDPHAPSAEPALELVPAHEPIHPTPPSSSALRKKLLSVGMRNLRGPIELEDEQAGNQAAAELREELTPLPLTDDERCYLEDVRARLKIAPKQDAYARLGVSQSTPQANLRTAYLQLVKKFHPDRAQSSPGLRQAAPDLDALFGLLREAYERIGSPEARGQYDASGRISNKAKSKSEDATLSLRKGEVYLKKRDYDNAHRELRRAVELDPTAETLAGLAWGLVSDRSQTSAGSRDEALKLVARALKLDQKNGRAHYVAGVLRRTSEPDAALEHFRRCIEIDPRNADAALEVRLLERRREKSNTGPLGRLFKRDGK